MNRVKVVAAGFSLAAVLLAAGMIISETQPPPPPVAPQPGQGLVIKGTLQYSTGQPAPRIPVIVRMTQGSRSVRQAITDDEGRFRLEGLDKGDYRLFDIRVYLNVKQGKCEVLAGRDLSLGEQSLDLGTLTMEPKIIPPVNP